MKEQATAGGLGLFSVIAVVLSILKLCSLITISWKTIILIWLAPLLIGLAVFAIIICVLAVAAFLKGDF